MSIFRIKVGDFDLIESGSIITMKDADIHFYIEDLEYVFRFVNTEEKGAKMHIASNDGKKMEIELQNFNDAIGIGNVNPIPMGTVQGKSLFMFFRVTQLEDGGKTMHYTWLSKPLEKQTNENHG